MDPQEKATAGTVCAAPRLQTSSDSLVRNEKSGDCERWDLLMSLAIRCITTDAKWSAGRKLLVVNEAHLRLVGCPLLQSCRL